MSYRYMYSGDATAFPVLGHQFPELAPVLTELSADHRLVADIVRRLRQLLVSVGPDNADTARRELDGLAAIVESHFQCGKNADSSRRSTRSKSVL
ncbi:hemerythrin domain-containing protein [Nocardia sp. GCM10030253]|uniref:hemerythrin domain-containing protein n=1 Tax=Nocardia sp. GCM10030253 TaxID=3273404 RepID=UPI00363B15D0